MDVLGAHLAAALRDVAEAEAGLRADELHTVVRVQRVHLERGVANEHAGSGKGLLVLLVVTDDVASVLAQEALDALVEFLDPVDVLLEHPARAIGLLGLRLERRDLLGLLVVVRDVGDEVLDDREGLHRRDRDLRAGLEGVHPGHAHQARLAVDLGAARAALAGFAVPAHGEVGRTQRLDLVDDVEDDHPLVGRHGVGLVLAARLGAAPDGECRLPCFGVTMFVAHAGCFSCFSSASTSCRSSSGSGGSASVVISRASPRLRVTTFFLPHSGSAFG